MLEISRKIGHPETTNQADVTFPWSRLEKPSGFTEIHIKYLHIIWEVWFCQSTSVLFHQHIFRYPDSLSWIQYSAQSPVPVLVKDNEQSLYIFTFHLLCNFWATPSKKKAARAHWYIIAWFVIHLIPLFSLSYSVVLIWSW